MPLRALIVARARGVGLWGMLLVNLCFCSAVSAQEQRFVFDISAQPLETALGSYGDVTGRDVVYNSTLAVGRQSTAVRGSLLPDAALMILLEGTGLAARYETSGSYVLLAAPRAAPPISSQAVNQFYGRLQTALRTALCTDKEVRPGAYRIAAQFWIGSSGDVMRYDRLSSTGDQSLDDSLDRSLRNFKIGAQPPAGLPQPITIVIAPHPLGMTSACGLHGARGNP